MNDDRQPLNQESRSKQRAKRRKTNIILNSLIIIVLLLIVIVSVNIFFDNDKTKKTSTDTNETLNDEIETSGTASQSDQNNKTDRNDEDNTASKNKKTDKKDKKDISDQQVVTEGGSDPEVKKTIKNPAWDPVETTQTGQHSSVYDGVDWDEMVQAITYATGIEESNMTINHLGNNGPNKSVGLITQKDTQQKFRVYIEWVNDEGWKPTLVEELE